VYTPSRAAGARKLKHMINRCEINEVKLAKNQVELLTMYLAEGLEFPVVFLIDLHDGTIPYIASHETEEADLAQERKLFYVSMTQA
jgi:DNA helicase II / ATP-dependent DNA helicase PcrA